MSRFDLVLNHSITQQYIKKFGYEKFIDLLEEKFKYRFYSCSQDWEYDSQYICKLKGRHGDIIIGWEGIHDSSNTRNSVNQMESNQLEQLFEVHLAKMFKIFAC